MFKIGIVSRKCFSELFSKTNFKIWSNEKVACHPVHLVVAVVVVVVVVDAERSCAVVVVASVVVVVVVDAAAVAVFVGQS